MKLKEIYIENLTYFLMIASIIISPHELQKQNLPVLKHVLIILTDNEFRKTNVYVKAMLFITHDK
jgi:hypothetical protein